MELAMFILVVAIIIISVVGTFIHN